MSDERERNLDRNIEKLLKRAPRPEDPRPEAQGEIFARVAARLKAGAEVKPRRSRRVLWTGVFAAAAAAAAALLLAVNWQPRDGKVIGKNQPTPPRPSRVMVRDLQPAVGRTIAEKLVDGSILEVAGGSKVKVTSWPDRNRPLVELRRGEVTCEVAKGKGQFKVKTPVGEAIALGTRFTVRLEGGADAKADEGDTEVNRRTLSALMMTVVVISGEVLVRDTAGFEQLAGAGETVKTGPMAVASKAKDSWTSGALVPRLRDGSVGKPLEVRRHSVNVTIKEQIALIEVDQVFYNDTKQRLEGTFYFPLPAGATISRLAMYVGDRLMEGEIAETQRARRTFEALLVQRRDPALLEWAGGNMFKMRVFPIEAKSEKRVLISYYQVLKREHGRIRFTYPLVSDSLQTHPVGKIEVKLSVASTPTIVASAVPGYKDAEVKAGDNAITVNYSAEKIAPARDFTLDYQVVKGEGELVVVPYWHDRDGEGYFLMIFSPELQEADSEKPAASRFVFVLDKSGGLGDRHLALAKKATRHALSLLKAGDEFGIVAYDTFAQAFKPTMVRASAGNVAAAGKWMDGLEAMGASDLSTAWQAAATLAGTEALAQVVYVGSGLSSLTSTRTARLVADAEKSLKGCEVRVHCLSIGDVQDAALLAELARRFDGTVRPLASADDVAASVGELMDDYAWPLYTGVRMEFVGTETDEIYPVWFPNVSAGRQLFAFGKYLRQGKAKVRLTASYKDKPYTREFKVDFQGEKSNCFVAKLWANEKIGHLQDVAALADGDASAKLVQTVIRTSKRYRVMSHYTSFIVLETAEDYERFGIERRNDEFNGKDDEAIGDIPLGGAGAWTKSEMEQGVMADAKRGPGKPGDRGRRSDKALQSGKLKKQSKSVEQLARSNAPATKRPAAPRAAAEAAKKAPGHYGTKGKAAGGGRAEERKSRLRSGEGFDTDVLAWARRDIFPVFRINELGALPYRHKHSSAEAMKILRNLAGRYKSLSLKVSSYTLDKEGTEKLEGRAWELALDTETRRFFSRKVGDDHYDISDGKVRVQFYPLLKYAARRRVTAGDVKALGGLLPAYIFPWAQKLDRRWYITVEKKGDDGLVLRLARRGNSNNRILIHLSSEKGPVTKIEVYENTWRRGGRYSRLTRTVECGEVKEVGGVKVPTVFKVTYHSKDGGRRANPEMVKRYEKTIAKLRAAGSKTKAEEMARKLTVIKAAAAGQTRTVRVTDLKINYKPKAGSFKVTIPKDWAIRDLDSNPRSKDLRHQSSPVNASNLVR